MSKTQVNKLHTLTGHNNSIYALAEGADPRFFYTGAGDGMVVEWDLEAPKDGRLMARLPHSVYALEVDRARNLLFIGHNFEGIHVIDLNTKEELWSLQITDHSIFDIQVFGDRLYVGTGGGVIVVLDIEERSLVKHLKISEESIRVFSLNTATQQLAVGSSDHSIKIINLDDLKPVAKLTGHSNSVFALAYSPDGRYLVSGSRDAHLKIWDGQTYGQTGSIVAHLFAINYLSFREDGKYFVTCSMDKSIKLWDAETFKLLKVIDKARHAGHGTSINKVLWSRYNQNVIAVSDDRTVSIWDIDI
jgi:WD repeat-containing protein 61